MFVQKGVQLKIRFLVFRSQVSKCTKIKGAYAHIKDENCGRQVTCDIENSG